MTHVRSLTTADLEPVVDLSLRAWAPVFASMASVLGPRLAPLVNPDWESAQATAVREVCSELVPHVYVAEVDGVVAGFAAVRLHGDDAPEPGSGEIEMIAVDPSYQRRGIASALIAHSEEAMTRSGCRFAVVATGGDAGHAPARAAYEAAGYTGLPLVRYYRVLDPGPAG